MKTKQEKTEQPIEILVSRFINGEDLLWSTIQNSFSHRSKLSIFEIVKDKHLTKDVFQEVCIKIFSLLKARKYKQNNFFSWVVKISKNNAIDYIRSQSFIYNRKKMSELNNDMIDLSDEYDFNRDKIEQTILEGIQKLKPSQRNLVELYYFKGLKVREIKEFVGISSIGTIVSGLSYARKNLKRMV